MGGILHGGMAPRALLSNSVCVVRGLALLLLTHTIPGSITPSVPFSSDAFSLYLKLNYLADSLVHFAIHFGTFAFYKV